MYRTARSTCSGKRGLLQTLSCLLESVSVRLRTFCDRDRPQPRGRVSTFDRLQNVCASSGSVIANRGFHSPLDVVATFDRLPALLTRIAFATLLLLLCFADRSLNEAEQSAICRRQLVSPDNLPAAPGVPLVPCSNRMHPGFESDRRNADPT